MQINQNTGRPAEIRAGTPGKLRVGFVLARSFTLSAFALFVDALRLGSDIADRSGRINCDWEILGSTRHFRQSSCGVQVSPTAELRRPADFDYIAVIGGLLKLTDPIDSETERYLKQAKALGVPVIGVCTGSFVLADAGLLQDRLACVSWLHYNEFRERFPELRATSQRIFVEDQDVITCAGGSSVADLATFLIRRHVGVAAERNALEILQINRRRDASEIQPRNPLEVTDIRDQRVSRSLMTMEQHVENTMDIEDIAASIGLSRRQMERLFQKELNTTPASVYLKIRLEAAMRLVANTDRPLIDIALETGFDSSSHFIRRFKKVFAVTPSALRKQSKTREQARMETE